MIPKELKHLREQIDQIDTGLIKLLSKRFNVTQKVWRIKKSNNLPKTDPKREEEKLSMVGNLAEENDVDGEFTKNIFKKIIEETKKKYD